MGVGLREQFPTTITTSNFSLISFTIILSPLAVLVFVVVAVVVVVDGTLRQEEGKKK